MSSNSTVATHVGSVARRGRKGKHNLKIDRDSERQNVGEMGILNIKKSVHINLHFGKNHLR
jgi:hypothetical protein